MYCIMYMDFKLVNTCYAVSWYVIVQFQSNLIAMYYTLPLDLISYYGDKSVSLAYNIYV